MFVDCSGCEVFTGSAGSGDQDGCVGRGDLLQYAEDLFHFEASAVEGAEVVCAAQVDVDLLADQFELNGGASESDSHSRPEVGLFNFE